MLGYTWVVKKAELQSRCRTSSLGAISFTSNNANEPSRTTNRAPRSVMRVNSPAKMNGETTTIEMIVRCNYDI